MSGFLLPYHTPARSLFSFATLKSFAKACEAIVCEEDIIVT